MKDSKFKLIRIIILIVILLLAIAKTGLWKNFVHPATAQTIGDLSVDWGVPADQPLFKILNMLPGDVITRQVKVMNNATVGRVISIKGIKTSETGNISQKLKLTITQNGRDVFGPKNLNHFFSESMGPSGLPLINLNPGEMTEFQFKVVFDSSANNSYQNNSVIFTIQFGVAAEIPEACKNIKFDKIIFGTCRSEVLMGTFGNDLIFGFEGNDWLFGSFGDDCLIGAEGLDVLSGGPGNDILVGGPNYDFVNGGLGKDRCEGELKFSCEL